MTNEEKATACINRAMRIADKFRATRETRWLDAADRLNAAADKHIAAYRVEFELCDA